MGKKSKEEDGYIDFDLLKHYKKETGSYNAAVLLLRIRYWWLECQKKEFYKSVRKFAKETGMSVSETMTASSRLAELGYIEIHIRACGDQPRMTYWTFCEEAIPHQNQDRKDSGK